MDGRCAAGGILELCRIAAEHQTPLAADLRSEFSVSLWDVGFGLSWPELWHLVSDLTDDPSSRLYTAISGNKHRVTREWILFADLYDLQAASKSKRKPKPYPRPWPDATQKRIGGKKTTRRTAGEVRAILRPLN